MSMRSFTVESSEVNKDGGRYISSSPYNAAAKAARVLFRESGTKKTQIRFKLRETTAGSLGKTRTYIGEKNMLKTPKIVVRGDTEIKIMHEYTIKACKA